MIKKPIIIAFAGVIGSSKTPIATFLSWNLNLPIYNNDAVRSEVLEDLMYYDEPEHKRRRDERLQKIAGNKMSFICDASMDREWEKFRPKLVKLGYRWFIISLDLSKQLILKLYAAKSYHESKQRLDRLFEEHEQFMKDYSNDIGLRITDQLFSQRLPLSFKAVNKWLGQKP